MNHRFSKSDTTPSKLRLIQRTLATLICLGFLVVLPLWGQTGTSGITGVVSDQQGKAVAGANVTLTNIATNAVRTASTTEAGSVYFRPHYPG